MISYFDTSAIVPLLVDGGGTVAARDIWLGADRLVSVHLTSVEARAALAQAARTARISPAQLRSSTQELEGLFVQLDLVDVDDSLIRQAADLTEPQALPAYDAVHLLPPCRWSRLTSSSSPVIKRCSRPASRSG